MAQMVVERSDTNIVSLGSQTYEISKLGRNVLVKKLLGQKEQEKVLAETKVNYTKMLKLSLPIDSSIKKNVEDVINMIKGNPKVKISKREEGLVKEDLNAIFKSLKK